MTAFDNCAIFFFLHHINISVHISKIVIRSLQQCHAGDLSPVKNVVVHGEFDPERQEKASPTYASLIHIHRVVTPDTILPAVITKRGKYCL